MGKIYLLTGDGAGKTTSALGLAMRSLGHGHKVTIVQFLKFWKEAGEYKIQEKLENFKVYQFGRPAWLKMGEKKAEFGEKVFNVEEANNLDRECALKGLEKAKEVLLDEKPDLLILDELCLVVHSNLLKIEEVLSLLENIPERTDVVITGRNASKELIERADFVNSVTSIKYPENSEAKKGIQY